MSARHLSFLETGRSQPSREMVLHLAEELDVPLRERNRMLLAAGYAPAYAERTIDAPEMAPVREALDLVLRGHEPYPARGRSTAGGTSWPPTAASALLTGGVAPELLEPPVNVLRLSLHPDGLAPRIANLGEWRAHLLDRLRREVALTADPRLAELLDGARGVPGRRAVRASHEPARSRSRCGCAPTTASCASSARSRRSAPRSTSRVAELSIEAFLPGRRRDRRGAARLTSDVIDTLPRRGTVVRTSTIHDRTPPPPPPPGPPPAALRARSSTPP